MSIENEASAVKAAATEASSANDVSPLLKAVLNKAGAGDGCGAKAALDHAFDQTPVSRWQDEIFNALKAEQAEYNKSTHDGRFPKAQVQLKIGDDKADGGLAIQAFFTPQPDKLFKDPLTGESSPLNPASFFEIRDQKTGAITSSLDGFSRKPERNEGCFDNTKMRTE